MAKQLLRGFNGALIFEDPGDLGYGEPEVPAVNPCGTTGCTSLGNSVQCPTINCTITSVDANLPITWVGVT